MGIGLAVRLIPPDVLAEHRTIAARILGSDHPRGWFGAAIVIAIWAAAAVWLSWSL